MARNFNTNTTAVMNMDTMAKRFENMLNSVTNMINDNNIYSVWIKLVIGKSKKFQIVFDTSSTNRDENLFIGLDYEKCGAGVANKFTFKVAYDLFHYGQNTKGNVEKLDELVYKAMNTTEYKEAMDMFYCKFQYGYNVTGNTQIVSPLYEGLILDIIPSIDYTNGKTYYTISGNSIISGASITYSFDEIGNSETEEGRWKGLDLVLWILWYYHGNRATISQLPQDYSGNIDNQHDDVKKGISPAMNIDIPADLMNSSSNVYMPQMNEMTAIDYCKEVLNKTVNINDSRFNGDTKNPDYDLEDDEFRPYYTLYITDSGGSGVPTIHIAFISSKDDENTRKEAYPINFNFTWYNQRNSIVINWQPDVSVRNYLLTRAENEHKKLTLQKIQDAVNSTLKDTGNNVKNAVEDAKNKINSIVKGESSYITGAAESVISHIVSGSIALGVLAANAVLDSKIKELSNTTEEFYKAKLTLVGIPCDIPIGVLLDIKPVILESISRTQGKYYTLGAKDTINSNGLFTTTIEVFRLKDRNKRN